MSESKGSEPKGKERRKGSPDRRAKRQDRRNAERVAEDIAPRRHPERRDRRGS